METYTLERLALVADQIEAHPEQFDYNSWVTHRLIRVPGDPISSKAPMAVQLDDLLGHQCGTTGCIAGWAAAIARRDMHHDDWLNWRARLATEHHRNMEQTVSPMAADWLGLDQLEADHLFLGQTMFDADIWVHADDDSDDDGEPFDNADEVMEYAKAWQVVEFLRLVISGELCIACHPGVRCSEHVLP